MAKNKKIKENQLEIRKNKIKNFFLNNQNYFLIIITIAIMLRIWVFFITLNQPIWWDEGDYLVTAKRWGLELPIRNIWYYRRTFFLPLFWALIYKLHGTETILRLTELLFSVATVIITYFLGKEVFNKKIALLAAFFLTTSRIHLFLTGRLLSSLPATFFITTALYFLWKSYINQKNPNHIYLAALFIALGMLTRLATALILLPISILIITKEKLKFLKNKKIIISIIIIITLMLPFTILYKQHYPSGIKDFIKHYIEIGKPKEQKSTFLGPRGIWLYFLNIKDNSILSIPTIGSLLYITLLILFFSDLFLAPDLIFKNPRIRKKLFMLLIILTPLTFHGLFSEYLQERYLLWTYPITFIALSSSLLKVYDYIKKYNKHIALTLLLLLLITGSYFQIKAANHVIQIKKNSYIQFKQAGLWIKQNSQPTDNIIGQGNRQLMYYSERSVYLPNKFKTPQDFNKNLTIIKPKYLVISILENEPDWLRNLEIQNGKIKKWYSPYINSYKKHLKLVKSFPTGIMIFEFISYPHY